MEIIFVLKDFSFRCSACKEVVFNHADVIASDRNLFAEHMSQHQEASSYDVDIEN